MSAIILLMATTLLYAGYNIFIKVSSGHVPAGAYSTITATICLQISALAISLLFLAVQKQHTDASLVLSTRTYLWAIAAGLCIGGAEIAYFYLFAGLGHDKPMAANIASFCCPLWCAFTRSSQRHHRAFPNCRRHCVQRNPRLAATTRELE